MCKPQRQCEKLSRVRLYTRLTFQPVAIAIILTAIPCVQSEFKYRTVRSEMSVDPLDRDSGESISILVLARSPG